MSPSNWRSGSFRRATGLAVAMLALGQLPGNAAVGPPLPTCSPSRLDLTWRASLIPVPAAAASGRELPPRIRFDDATNQFISQAAPSPGLQFSLNPDNEEVFLGWQIEF